MTPQPFPWCDPLTLARQFSGPMVLLHSSARTGYSGRYSILAANLAEMVDIEHFDQLSPLLKRDKARYEHAWFGYLGYELRHDVERYTPARPGATGLPGGRMMRFCEVYLFDHEAKRVTLWADAARELPPLSEMEEQPPPPLLGLTSNMTRAGYEAKASRIIRDIAAGDLYQANLTRKFYGTWNTAPDGLSLFSRMCRLSPAPYSAYLRMEDAEILSSSPELFLKLEDGKITARPIKGTAPRGSDAVEDARIRLSLEQSTKDRAENLMITDLMRNDLARSCVDGSVSVSGLFDVTEHATIFHMASTISGTASKNATIPGMLKGAFPPGSMTGAPKIRAVELCNTLEEVERGIYSGAVGWFGGDGALELSVVIRTLIVQKERFEFQVGGGIVADSTPAGEWQETMDKAAGILKTLDIPAETITSL